MACLLNGKTLKAETWVFFLAKFKYTLKQASRHLVYIFKDRSCIAEILLPLYKKIASLPTKVEKKRKLQSNENVLILPLTSFILLQVPALSPVHVATTCGLTENTLESIALGLLLGFFILYRIFQGLGSHCLERDKRAYRCSSCTSSFRHSVC